VPAGERTLHVIGLNPTAVVDPDGFDEWAKQIDTLIAALPSLDRPFVLAGDFNTTQFRPEYKRLLEAGLIDAHDALGKGLTTSFKLSAEGALAAPGTVVRLDHALLSDGVAALGTEDLEASGSDHLPFRLTLAVRQDGAPISAPPPSPPSQ
jgi:endonuclease/exonuclease/phosphatase family metal-dependent hydrolase